MPDTHPTIGPGTRFAFAPYPVKIENLLYRICVVFETNHGELMCAYTNLMATNLENADTMCDNLNTQVDLTREQWKCLASAVFDAVESAAEAQSHPAPEDSPR